ncbi:MAG: YybS family protein [Clostridium sp.]|nr:YybS family protein [Clostridium sp.]
MQNKNYTAKVIAEIGIMFAITLIIIMATAYIPVISDLGMFILPIPITIIYIKNNYKIALITVIMSIIVTAFTYNPISGLTSGIIYGVVGISLGYCIKNKKNSGVTIIIVAIAAVLGNISRFIIYAKVMSNKGIKEYLNLIVNQFKQSLEASKDLYIQVNAPKEAIDYLDQFISYINIETLLVVIPMIFIISSLIQSYVSYLITHKILKRLKYEVKDIIPFSRVYIPNKLEALLIIIAAVGIILNSKGINKASYMFTIANFLVTLTLTLDGMAYCAYLLREKAKASRGVTFLILIVMLFVPIFSNLYSLFGLMDIILNSRKLDPDPIRKIKSRE